VIGFIKEQDTVFRQREESEIVSRVLNSRGGHKKVDTTEK